MKFGEYFLDIDAITFCVIEDSFYLISIFVQNAASVELLVRSCLLDLFLRHVCVSPHRWSTEVHCSRNLTDGFVSLSSTENFTDLIFVDHA